MYLTDKHNKTPRSMDDHQTAELLLEYCELVLGHVDRHCR